jgi:hypothetical protein
MALHSTLGPGFNALLPGLLCSIISCHEREGPHARPPSVGAFCKMQCLPASPLCSDFCLFMLGLNKVMRDDGIT